MRQFTTPIESLFIPGHSLTGSRIFVSFADKCRKHTITVTEDIDVVQDDEQGSVIEVHLTQEQTGIFDRLEPIDIQVNWITQSGERNATEIVSVPCWENLMKEVIE